MFVQIAARRRPNEFIFWVSVWPKYMWLEYNMRKLKNLKKTVLNFNTYLYSITVFEIFCSWAAFTFSEEQEIKTIS